MDSIREATAHDTVKLASIYGQCCEEADWLPLSSKRQTDFERDTAGETIFVSVAPNGSITGFIAVWMPESFIHHLYVSRDACGQGVGTALLQFLRGRVPLPWRLKCGQANTQAASFYRNRGWELVESIDHDVEPFFLLQFTG
jgi:GNAT superfamily N-acetyltransferase